MKIKLKVKKRRVTVCSEYYLLVPGREGVEGLEEEADGSCGGVHVLDVVDDEDVDILVVVREGASRRRLLVVRGDTVVLDELPCRAIDAEARGMLGCCK